MSAPVAKLPTAAPRQVPQRWNKQTRAEAMALRDEHAGRFPYMFPAEREVLHLADFIENNPITPERQILIALIRAVNLDYDARLKMALDVVGEPSAKNIVELAFADARKTFNVQSVLRRRGLV